jgi:hypothetical protein
MRFSSMMVFATSDSIVMNLVADSLTHLLITFKNRD